MPHRDATHAALARVTQLRGRIAEIDVRAVGSLIEPTSLAGAMAERERLELLLLAVERAANAVAEQGASAVAEHDEVAPMVIQDWPAREPELSWRDAGPLKLVMLGMGPFLILAVLYAWPE